LQDSKIQLDELTRAPTAGRQPPIAPADQATEVVTAPQPAPVVRAAAAPLPTNVPPEANPTCEGAIWIGSNGAGNLRPAGPDAGSSVAVTDIQRDATFIANATIRLRRGLPSSDGAYTHQQPIGIVPRGAQIIALDRPAGFDRPAGTQYWLSVRVAGQVCSLVYFQFTGGTPQRAREIALALEGRGYLVPGQEQLRSAAGLAEVRYYFAEDRGRALALTQHVREVAGIRQQVSTTDMTGWTRTKPPIGTLELWLDLSLQ